VLAHAEHLEPRPLNGQLSGVLAMTRGP
jgi:hypothetical protein